MSLQRNLEVVSTKAAKAAWPVLQGINKLLGEGKSVHPKWAPAPLLKSYEKGKPTLGFPRETLSLCPKCVKDVREEILSGKRNYKELITGHFAEIKAQIIEENNQIFMIKSCEKHGDFREILSTNAAFTRRIESLFPGNDFKNPEGGIREHGTSSVQYGRGSVLTVDLTNRCNMMCEPCFTDANQVGYVHELEMAQIREILDAAANKVKPRRQLSVQFSGGEPTLSPLFIDAIKYAKEVGFFSVQAASNGIRFAESLEFCQAAYDAGLRLVYFQFDGVGNENNAHRKISNLFDIKLKAMDNLAKVGIDIVLVTTIVNTVNNHQIGPIIDFATENADKISFISFQPVSFTGRDEDITDEDRLKKRYTLSHLADDVKKQAGVTDPLRDWFPLSFISTFSDFTDMMAGAEATWGSLGCGCHPNCGSGTAFLVDKKTKTRTAISDFLNVEQLAEDVKQINDASRGSALNRAQIVSAILRNYNPAKAPAEFTLKDLLTKFDKQSGGSLGGEYGVGKERKKDRWLVLFVAGMWFQDLFTYDFERTKRCVIPYGTQEGEISFCAHNTGIGWRQIIEYVHQNATVGEWYKTKGRHKIYANNGPVELKDFTHSLKVKGEDPGKLLRLPAFDRNVKMSQAA